MSLVRFAGPAGLLIVLLSIAGCATNTTTDVVALQQENQELRAELDDLNTQLAAATKEMILAKTRLAGTPQTINTSSSTSASSDVRTQTILKSLEVAQQQAADYSKQQQQLAHLRERNEQDEQRIRRLNERIEQLHERLAQLQRPSHTRR